MVISHNTKFGSIRDSAIAEAQSANWSEITVGTLPYGVEEPPTVLRVRDGQEKCYFAATVLEFDEGWVTDLTEFHCLEDQSNF